MDDQRTGPTKREKRTKHLVGSSVAAVAFVLFESWIAYTKPNLANFAWVAFSLVCLLWVAGLWAESRRQNK